MRKLRDTRLWLCIITIVTFTSCVRPATKSPSSFIRIEPSQSAIPLATGEPAWDETLRAPASRPNIVVILVDDMDAEAADHMPFLQSLLVKEGASFQHFYVNVSLCCPSRATILRGQLAHNTQIYANLPPAGGFEKFQELGEEAATIAVWLQSAGYRTAMIGKYLNGYPPPEDPAYIPPGWDEWYSPSGGKPYTQYHYTLNENGKQVVYRASVKDYGSDVLAGKAIDFVERAAASGEPFFAFIAPYAPHGPSTPAPRHAKFFNALKAPRPPSFNEQGVRDKPGYIRSRSRLSEAQINRIDRLYRRRLRSLQAVDEMIAGLVEAVRSAGVLGNTYFFFTSDNGFMLGQHRLDPGKVVPYEESIRVPLIVRGPGVPAGLQITNLAGNIDLAPTWAELAAVPAPGFVDGRSLVPLWRDSPSTAGWRQAFLIEYGPWGAGSGAAADLPEDPASTDLPGVLEPSDTWGNDAPAAGNGTPGYRALRMADGSIYIEYDTGEREFYDLGQDPYQLQNTAGNLDASRLARLSAWLEGLSRCAAATCRSIESQMLNP